MTWNPFCSKFSIQETTFIPRPSPPFQHFLAAAQPLAISIEVENCLSPKIAKTTEKKQARALKRALFFYLLQTKNSESSFCTNCMCIKRRRIAVPAVLRIFLSTFACTKNSSSLSTAVSSCSFAFGPYFRNQPHHPRKSSCKCELEMLQLAHLL